jgi:outer membrane protein assembly factor BamE (lipoprotein component of BamABCDE complex)
MPSTSKILLTGGYVKKIALLALAGCAGVGNDSLRTESEATVSTKIAEGKTTKDQVRDMFGSPSKTEFTDAGLEVWHYEFAKMHADGVDFIPVVNLFGSSHSGQKKELVVLFDTNNVVKRYSMNVSDVSVKTGVFNQ